MLLFSVTSIHLNAADSLKQRISYIDIVPMDTRHLFLKATSTRSKQRLSLCQKTNQEFLNFKSQVPSTGQLPLF